MLCGLSVILFNYVFSVYCIMFILLKMCMCGWMTLCCRPNLPGWLIIVKLSCMDALIMILLRETITAFCLWLPCLRHIFLKPQKKAHELCPLKPKFMRKTAVWQQMAQQSAKVVTLSLLQPTVMSESKVKPNQTHFLTHQNQSAVRVVKLRAFLGGLHQNCIKCKE